ncbi:MAG: hypothetical protein IPI04_12800 [Ignavibacteria bacterium]|nr:hypothetical protein [Ignavibacteria bacterium]
MTYRTIPRDAIPNNRNEYKGDSLKNGENFRAVVILVFEVFLMMLRNRSFTDPLIMLLMLPKIRRLII